MGNAFEDSFNVCGKCKWVRYSGDYCLRLCAKNTKVYNTPEGISTTYCDSAWEALEKFRNENNGRCPHFEEKFSFIKAIKSLFNKRLKMKNKTCGECRFFESKEFICCHSGDDVEAYFIACSDFEPMMEHKPTNGDRIRQMSNEKLVRFKGARHCTFCAYCDQMTDKCNRPIGGTCAEGILEWLNAPAESEVRDE